MLVLRMGTRSVRNEAGLAPGGRSHKYEEQGAGISQVGSECRCHAHLGRWLCAYAAGWDRKMALLREAPYRSLSLWDML